MLFQNHHPSRQLWWCPSPIGALQALLRLGSLGARLLQAILYAPVPWAGTMLRARSERICIFDTSIPKLELSAVQQNRLKACDWNTHHERNFGTAPCHPLVPRLDWSKKITEYPETACSKHFETIFWKIFLDLFCPDSINLSGCPAKYTEFGSHL